MLVATKSEPNTYIQATLNQAQHVGYAYIGYSSWGVNYTNNLEF